MKLKNWVFNLCAFIVVYFIPLISNLLNIPLYLLEPMRIIVVVAIIHTSKANAYLLAVSLPIFSFLLSNHPSLLKTVILSGDLLLNIFIYFYLTKFINNKFLLMGVSIIISKIVYYLLKYTLIKLYFLKGDLIATPIYIQLAIVVILSAYVYYDDIMLREKLKNY